MILTIPEIALGLTLVYLMLSLVASWLNEFIVAIFELRAKSLETAIQNLLRDPPEYLSNPHGFIRDHPEFDGYMPLISQFYHHPLIRTLTAHDSQAKKPAHIEPQTFALVTLDILFPEQDLASIEAVDLREMIQGSGLDPDLKMTLMAIIEGGARNIQELRQGVEKWFDNSMSQMSVWYKGRVRMVMLIIGALLAVGFNIDSLRIAEMLWQEPDLRASVASYAQQNMASLSPDQVNDTGAVIARMSQFRETVSELGFPIGWQAYGPGTVIQNAQANNQSPSEALTQWLFERIIGWALTTLAVGQGAPFWFDIMKKLVAPSKA